MKIYKTLRKRGLALFLALTMCLSLLPATALAADGGADAALPVTAEELSPDTIGFSGGTGTADDPYLISSAGGLRYLAQVINSEDTLDYKEKYFALTADIDLGGAEWTPIGTDAAHSFFGTFYGGGHTISNFTVSGNAAGLFGYVTYAHFYNLTINNATVIASGTDCAAGALAAVDFSRYNFSLENSTKSKTVLDNCHVVNSTVQASGSMGSSRTNPYYLAPCAGGLLGTASRKTDIQYCTVKDSTINSNYHAGGVLGSVTIDSSTVHIKNTACTGGTVSASSTSYGYAGGIVGAAANFKQGFGDTNNPRNGFFTFSIENCLNTSSISSGKNTGGIVGYQYTGYTAATVRNCLTTGTVKSNKAVGYSSPSISTTSCYTNAETAKTKLPSSAWSWDDDGTPSLKPCPGCDGCKVIEKTPGGDKAVEVIFRVKNGQWDAPSLKQRTQEYTRPVTAEGKLEGGLPVPMNSSTPGKWYGLRGGVVSEFTASEIRNGVYTQPTVFIYAYPQQTRTVTFDLRDGTDLVYLAVPEGESIPVDMIPNTESHTGNGKYTFQYWEYITDTLDAPRNGVQFCVGADYAQWNLNTGKVTEDVTLYAYWGNMWYAQFVTSGGPDVPSQRFLDPDEVKKPVVRGYEILEWYYAAYTTYDPFDTSGTIVSPHPWYFGRMNTMTTSTGLSLWEYITVGGFSWMDVIDSHGVMRLYGDNINQIDPYPWEDEDDPSTLTDITKSVLKAVPTGVELDLPKVEVEGTEEDITLSYPSEDGKLTVAADTDSVTLLYEITVKGQAGAAFKVTDEDAVLVGNVNAANVKQNDDKSITGTIADGQTEAILYVVRTFTKGEGWNISNTAYLQAGNDNTELKPDGDKTPNDDGELPSNEVETLVGSPLAVTKELISGSVAVTPGSTIKWKITITNGSDSAKTVEVTDTLLFDGSEVSGKSASIFSDEDCTTALTNPVSVPANNSVDVYATYNVVEGDVGKAITNKVTVENTADPTDTDDDTTKSPVTPSVEPSYGIDVVKVKEIVGVNGEDSVKVKYTVTVTNTGNQTLYGLKIVDTADLGIDLDTTAEMSRTLYDASKQEVTSANISKAAKTTVIDPERDGKNWIIWDENKEPMRKENGDQKNQLAWTMSDEFKPGYSVVLTYQADLSFPTTTEGNKITLRNYADAVAGKAPEQSSHLLSLRTDSGLVNGGSGTSGSGSGSGSGSSDPGNGTETEIARIKLIYDANGGSNAPAAQEKVDFADNLSYYEFTVDSTVPQHSAGYKFLGWSDSATTPGRGSANDVTHSAGSKITVQLDASPKTIYAVWAQAFTVSYNLNLPAGTVDGTPPAKPDDAKYIEGETVTVAAKPTNVIIGGKEYTFTGWTTNDATIENGTFNMPAKDVTLTGSWSEVMKPDPKNLAVTKTTNAAGNNVKAGQTFNYTITVANNGTLPMENIVVTDVLDARLTPTLPLTYGASWNEAARTITWTIQKLNGTASTALTIPVTVSGAVNAGDTILNTAVVTTANNEDIPAAEQPKGEVTVTVVEDVTYTLIYDPNGGSGGPGTETQNSNIFRVPNSIPTPPTTPPQPGFTFKGWSDTRDGKEQYGVGDTIIITDGSTKTVYAVWKANPVKTPHTVTYNWGNIPFTPEEQIPEDQIYYQGDPVTVDPTVVKQYTETVGTTTTTWTFLGWTEDGGLVVGSFLMPDADVTLTGKWTSSSITTSPDPRDPELPTYDELAALIDVEVVCRNSKADHTPSRVIMHLLPNSYDLYQQGSMCTVTIHSGRYEAEFVRLYGEHDGVDVSDKVITLRFAEPNDESEAQAEEFGQELEDEQWIPEDEDQAAEDEDQTFEDEGQTPEDEKQASEEENQASEEVNISEEEKQASEEVKVSEEENQVFDDENPASEKIETLSLIEPYADETNASGWVLANGEGHVTVTFIVECQSAPEEDEPFTVTFVDGLDNHTIDTKRVTVFPDRSEYPTPPDHAGYRFDHWDAPVKDVNGNYTVTARYVKQVTVTWVDENGNPVGEPITIDEGSSYTNPAGLDENGHWGNPVTDANGNITIRWIPETPDEPEMVTVTWRTGYGANAVIDTVRVVRGSDYSNLYPVDPTRSGYRFTGWSTPVADTNGNITITAQWTSTGGTYYPPTPTTPGTPSTPTTIPDTPAPLDPGDTIADQDVPLAGAVGLNDTDHFAYVIGYPDDTVHPLGNITRAEVATIFFRLMEDDFRQANWATTNSFTDVKEGDWYNNAISTCAKAGILRGREDGRFDPKANITRAEFAAIAARFLSDEYTDDGVGDFSDTAGKWYSADVRKAVKAGWILGNGNKFEPDAYITRAQVMTIVNRMLDRTPDAGHMLPEMKKWADNPEGTWYYEAVQEATNEHDYTRDESSVETWSAIKEHRDWAALELGWAANNGASASKAEAETQGLPDGI